MVFPLFVFYCGFCLFVCSLFCKERKNIAGWVGEDQGEVRKEEKHDQSVFFNKVAYVIPLSFLPFCLSDRFSLCNSRAGPEIGSHYVTLGLAWNSVCRADWTCIHSLTEMPRFCLLCARTVYTTTPCLCHSCSLFCKRFLSNLPLFKHWESLSC